MSADALGLRMNKSIDRRERRWSIAWHVCAKKKEMMMREIGDEGDRMETSEIIHGIQVSFDTERSNL